MRLLVVEDEEMFAQNLKKLLELKGFAVDWMETAEKAYNRIQLYQKEYDVALLDLNLPTMGGKELTQKLPAVAVTIPINILTGDGEAQNKIARLNSGADDYIVNPFSVDE